MASCGTVVIAAAPPVRNVQVEVPDEHDLRSVKSHSSGSPDVWADDPVWIAVPTPYRLEEAAIQSSPGRLGEPTSTLDCDPRPWEVQKPFHKRTLGLAVLQNLAVLVATAALDQQLGAERQPFLLVVCIVVVAAAAPTLAVLWRRKDSYPANCALLALAMLEAITFWAAADACIFADRVNLPTQVMGIMGVALLVVLAFVQVNIRGCGCFFPIFGGMLAGWVLGVSADVAVVVWVADLPASSAAAAGSLALCALLMLMFYAGPPMIRCSPDEYTTVAFAMTCNLFLVLSLPVLFVIFSSGGCACGGAGGGGGPSGSEEGGSWSPGEAKERPADGGSPRR
mmetsp:Transcript_55002/g.154705  ORF Transcript_55002/g.154705 Transcript_55002/m.154705 type:complete len:339 (-) Transcript_55002:88-1104(-)